MGDQMMMTKFNNSQAGPPGHGQLTKYSVDSINDINQANSGMIPYNAYSNQGNSPPKDATG